MGVDITSTLHLDIAAGGSFAHKTPKERKEFLDYISGKFSFLTNPSKPHQESMSSHKRPSVAESEPLPSTSKDSFVEPSPEPGTSEEEEIEPPKFPLQFEDDPSGNYGNTLNFFDAQLGKELSSVHADQSRNLLTEPSLRPMECFSPPNPPNEALLKEAMKEEWSDGVRYFFEAIWSSSPYMIIPCSIRRIA
jgi:hypothetical protein